MLYDGYTLLIMMIITTGKEYKDFRSGFENEKREMLVLMLESVESALVMGGGILKPSAYFIAAVDIGTGEFSGEKGCLEWLIKDKDRMGRSWGYDLNQYSIYHIIARKNIPTELSENMGLVMNNRYLLIKVIGDSLTDERLEKLKQEYMKPVYIGDEETGRLTLDRRFSQYEGRKELFGEICRIYMDTDEKNGTKAEKTFAYLKHFLSRAKELDEKYRRYAADTFIGTVNKWGIRDETYTKEELYGMIRISEVTIASDGEITVYYTENTEEFGDFAIEIKCSASSEDIMI